MGAIAAACLGFLFLMQYITIRNIPSAATKPKPVEIMIHAGVPKSSVLQPKTRQLRKISKFTMYLEGFKGIIGTSNLWSMR